MVYKLTLLRLITYSGKRRAIQPPQEIDCLALTRDSDPVLHNQLVSRLSARTTGGGPSSTLLSI